MKKTTLSLSLALPIAAFSAPRTGPWTKEQAWEWYKAQPWMRGCNYMPASAANRVDQWQELGSEERFEEVERELTLAFGVDGGDQFFSFLTDFSAALFDQLSFGVEFRKFFGGILHGDVGKILLLSKTDRLNGNKNIPGYLHIADNGIVDNDMFGFKSFDQFVPQIELEFFPTVTHDKVLSTVTGAFQT